MPLAPSTPELQTLTVTFARVSDCINVVQRLLYCALHFGRWPPESFRSAFLRYVAVGELASCYIFSLWVNIYEATTNVLVTKAHSRLTWVGDLPRSSDNIRKLHWKQRLGSLKDYLMYRSISLSPVFVRKKGTLIGRKDIGFEKGGYLTWEWISHIFL